MQFLKRIALGFMVFGYLAGCSSAPIDENDPAALLKEAEEEIRSDRYILALEKLRIIKNKFPYSKLAVDAQLRIADVYFLQESYVEAAASYESFRDLHPKHEKTQYAMLRVGKSYFKDIPSTISRDLTPAQKALDAYNDFLRRFPTGTDSEEVKKDIFQIRNFLAEKELSIGNFYYKRDLYDSAKPRYKKVIELYSDTEAAKAAEEKLTELARTKAEEPPRDGQATGQP